MRYLITLIIFSFLQISAFATPVKDFSANYELYHNGMYVGETTRHLKTENKFLTFSSVAKTAGIAAWFFDVTITETSKLRLKDKNLNFFSYSYHEKSKDKNEGYQLRLDKAQTFYNSYKKETYPAAKNLHDTLGFTVAIMHDLQAGKREIKYSIAEKKNLKTYILKFIKKENIETSNGEISTLKMEHYDPQTKNRFTLWCAEKMDFLPIRILKINHKGNESLLNLTHFNNKEIYLNIDEEEESF